MNEQSKEQRPVAIPAHLRETLSLIAIRLAGEDDRQIALAVDEIVSVLAGTCAAPQPVAIPDGWKLVPVEPAKAPSVRAAMEDAAELMWEAALSDAAALVAAYDLVRTADRPAANGVGQKGSAA